jgi:hypothetical protein
MDLPAFTDPAIVAVLALLHHGRREDAPITLCAHSQGGIITGIAILLFGALNTRNAIYLKKKVRVFHMEAEITIGFRKKIRGLVQQYLVYIMNESDPLGTDPLTELSAGDLPLLPNQNYDPNDPYFRDLRETLLNPRPLDLTYYQSLKSNMENIVINGIPNFFQLSYEIYGNNFFDLRKHNMPAQLDIIEKDIRDNRFRTDPGVLGNRTVQLSTNIPMGPTSVRVRNFFTG